MDENEKPKAMGKVIQIDEARTCDLLGEIVRGTVDEALNAEADRLRGAARYERKKAARTSGRAIVAGRLR